mmetsp:Transcript_11156/g.34879  ORF Transcript_11156/g.34879 Transcript_11156/m.34879 type:complete len:274 (+) Transcript_11156:891-1712(+)
MERARRLLQRVRPILAPRVELLREGCLRADAALAGPALAGLAPAAQGRVRARARGEEDLADLARRHVEVHAVLGQELHLAVGLEPRQRRRGDHELHRGEEHAQAVPLALLHRELGLPHAVDEHEDGRGVHRAALRVPPEVAHAPVLHAGAGGAGARGRQGEAHVHQAEDHELLGHLGDLRGQAALLVLHDEGAVEAAASLHGRAVVVVRVVPVRAGHVVLGHLQLDLERFPRRRLLEDVVRAFLGAHVQPVRVEVRGVQLAEAVPRENQLLAP